jgi:hypothetical protein
MDDHASSDGASPSESFTSSRTSSSPSQDLRRPKQVRQTSDTHVLPARSMGCNNGFATREANSRKSRAALRELLNPTMESWGSDERSRLLNNGLQWLLETSASSRAPNRRVDQPSVPLSREAVGTFNSENERRSAGDAKPRYDTGLGSRSTTAWLDDQDKVKTLPPW